MFEQTGQCEALFIVLAFVSGGGGEATVISGTGELEGIMQFQVMFQRAYVELDWVNEDDL